MLPTDDPCHNTLQHNLAAKKCGVIVSRTNTAQHSIPRLSQRVMPRHAAFKSWHACNPAATLTVEASVTTTTSAAYAPWNWMRLMSYDSVTAAVWFGGREPLVGDTEIQPPKMPLGVALACGSAGSGLALAEHH
jgi:hypothetical protein